MKNFRTIVTAAAVPVLLAACAAEETVDLRALADPGEGFTGSGDTFFNDTDQIAFADSMGGSFSDIFSALGAMSNVDNSVASGTIGQRMNRETQRNTENCDTSGTATVTSTIPDSFLNIDPDAQALTVNDIGGISASIVFNNCTSDGVTAQGGVSFGVTSANDAATISVDFDNLETLSNGDYSSIDGSIAISGTGTLGNENATISGTNITLDTVGEVVTIPSYTLTSQRSESTGVTAVSGSSEITSTQHGTVYMLINPALETLEGNDYPTTGTINWTHDDDSSLVINADNGDAASFSYEISDGVTTISGTEQWANTDIDFSL